MLAIVLHCCSTCHYEQCSWIHQEDMSFPLYKIYFWLKVSINPVSLHPCPPVFEPRTWASCWSALPELTTCLQGQPEYLGVGQPAVSQILGRQPFGLTSNETWSVEQRWRWGWDRGSCILQISARQTGWAFLDTTLFWPWLFELGKSVCMCVGCQYFFRMSNRSVNFSPHFLMWSD